MSIDHLVSDDDTVHASSHGNVNALDPETGDEKWSASTDSSELSLLNAIDDTIYYVSNSDISALAATSGQEIWSSGDKEDHSHLFVGAYEDVIFVAIYPSSLGPRFPSRRDTEIHAVDISGDTELWDTIVAPAFKPILVDDVVYTGTSGNQLYALDAITGEEIWSFTSRGSLFRSPTVVDDTVYVATEDNHVHAIGAAKESASEN